MGSSEMEITKQEILAQSRGIAGMGRIMRDWNHEHAAIESLSHSSLSQSTRVTRGMGGLLIQ